MAGLTIAAEKKGARVEVSIKNLKFAPASVTIKAGDTVVWTNNDDSDHTVEADDGSFKSTNLKSGGDPYERQFTKAGTYTYHCSLHPRMKGKVIVK